MRPTSDLMSGYECFFLLYRISDRQFYDLKDLAILELKDLKNAMFQDREILS